MSQSVAERLRIARIHAGFRTQQQAATHFGWKLPTYKTHEHSDRDDREGHLRSDVAVTYAKAYGISVAWLLTGEGEMIVKPKHLPPTTRQIVALLEGLNEADQRRILAYAEGIASSAA